MRPLRGDWLARLEEEVLAATGPVVLVAHSLGCILVAAWAAHSRNTHRVRAALLVAPGDVERDDLRQMIPGWAPIVRQRAAVPARCWSRPQRSVLRRRARARGWPRDWGARFVDAGAGGHLNAESGLGDWPEGRALLNDLMKERMTSMATKKPKGLGRGLEALLGPTAAASRGARRRRAEPQPRPARPSLMLDQMVPGVYQPRTRMDEGALYELAESIKAQGIMQPILVRRLDADRPPPRTPSTKSSPASAASAPPSWPAWTACRCWCATCRTRPPPRCR